MSEQLALLDPCDTGADAVPEPERSPVRARQTRPLTLKPSAVRVLNALRLREEATADVLAAELGSPQNCVSSRLKELERLGRAEWTNRKIDGSHDRPLKVWRITEKVDLL